MYLPFEKDHLAYLKELRWLAELKEKHWSYLKELQ